MEMKLVSFLWAFGLVMLIAMGARTVAGITCTEAITTLLPCNPFLLGTIPSPSPSCCLGVEAVKRDASTKENRQQLCECFKKAIGAIGIKPDRAKQLPNLCHVEVPVPIDPNIDCSKIN